MEKKYSRSHIGKVFTTKQGYKITVIDGGSKMGCCTIQINDWTKESYTGAKTLKTVSYPYHPTVYATGFIGVGNYSNKNNTKVFSIWSRMLERCYNYTSLNVRPTYVDVTVHPDWYNFQVFAEWFYEESNYQEGWDLDKDLLSTGNKVYSKDTCLFVPHALNSFLTNVKSDNTSGHIGVSWSKNSRKWQAQVSTNNTVKHLGYFTNILDAAEAYKIARAIEAVKQQKKYLGVLPECALNNIH